MDHDFSDETAANLTLTLFDEDRNVGTPLADNSQQSLDAAFRFRHDDEKLGNFRLSVFGAAEPEVVRPPQQQQEPTASAAPGGGGGGAAGSSTAGRPPPPAHPHL